VAAGNKKAAGSSTLPAAFFIVRRRPGVDILPLRAYISGTLKPRVPAVEYFVGLTEGYKSNE
jgi:hypothetical protein